jgi:hypothetical protein
MVEGEAEFKVERIEDSTMFRRQLRDLVMWTGYDKQSWEAASNVDGH